MNENAYADISANGDTDWVSLRGGAMVSVDCVDGNGDSTSFGGATVTLLYSPDAKMRCTVSDSSGDVTGTDGFCRNMENLCGFVAINVASYSSGKFRICSTKGKK